MANGGRHLCVRSGPPDPVAASRAKEGAVDAWVDYADNSPDPILAIGDAYISLAGRDPGWENGDSVNYQLTDGPLRGRYVYLAESIIPTVRTDQRVAAGQQIAVFVEPNVHGIETGWSRGPGRPVPKAAVLGVRDLIRANGYSIPHVIWSARSRSSVSGKLVAGVGSR